MLKLLTEYEVEYNAVTAVLMKYYTLLYYFFQLFIFYKNILPYKTIFVNILNI